MQPALKFSGGIEHGSQPNVFCNLAWSNGKFASRDRTDACRCDGSFRGVRVEISTCDGGTSRAEGVVTASGAPGACVVEGAIASGTSEKRG